MSVNFTLNRKNDLFEGEAFMDDKKISLTIYDIDSEEIVRNLLTKIFEWTSQNLTFLNERIIDELLKEGDSFKELKDETIKNKFVSNNTLTGIIAENNGEFTLYFSCSSVIGDYLAAQVIVDNNFVIKEIAFE